MNSTQTARILTFLAALVATASGHNVVSIRGELLADAEGVTIRTSWNDLELSSFRVEPALPETPGTDDLNQAIAIGHALSESLCLSYYSDPAGCSRARFAAVAVKPEERDAAGVVIRARTWELTHRIDRERNARYGEVVFIARTHLRSHPITLVLAIDSWSPIRTVELTPDRCAVRVELTNIYRYMVTKRSTYAGPYCGNELALIYGDIEHDHTHSPIGPTSKPLTPAPHPR